MTCEPPGPHGGTGLDLGSLSPSWCSSQNPAILPRPFGGGFGGGATALFAQEVFGQTVDDLCRSSADDALCSPTADVVPLELPFDALDDRQTTPT